jgi:hypothetical protein
MAWHRHSLKAQQLVDSLVAQQSVVVAAMGNGQFLVAYDNWVTASGPSQDDS